MDFCVPLEFDDDQAGNATATNAPAAVVTRARLVVDPNLESVVVAIARKEALERGIALDIPEGDGGVDGPMGA